MTEEELAEKSGDVVDGVRYQKNGKDGSRYHTNWLNMMYPRLKIARELLSDDGVIFISIGQDEISELTKMCDEVYGEINHLGTISRIMKSGGNKGRFFSPNIDYILVYGKNQTATKEFKGEMDQELIDKLYNKIETEGTRKGERYRPFGLYQSSLDERPNQRYYIECPDGSFVIPPGKTMPNTIEDAAKVLPNKGDGCWRWSQERYIEERKNGNILFTPSKSGVLIQPDGTKSQWNVYTKIWLSDRQEEGQTPIDFISKYENRHSAKELKELDIKFDFAKPTALIKYLISLVSDNRECVVLDFFSGSATTADSVMQLNVEDRGNRKYIMIQLPELCDEKSDAAKAGYKNICEIGKERIRRAAKKIHEDNPDAKFDDGFKVFEVADTNIRWNTADDEEIKRLDETDYGNDKERIDFTKGYTDIDVVYEIMLRQFDIPLSTPIEKLTQVSDRTYIFADAVVVCLEPEITTELIEKLAAIEPTPAKFVLRDSAFNDDIELKDVSFRRLSALIKNHQTEEERKSKYNNYTVEFI